MVQNSCFYDNPQIVRILTHVGGNKHDREKEQDHTDVSNRIIPYKSVHGKEYKKNYR